MTKKDRRNRSGSAGGDVRRDAVGGLISRRGWKIIGLGAVVVIVGYIILSFTDPAGKNWASHLSPFLLIGGYSAVGFGIVAKDRGEPATSEPSHGS